MSAQRKNDTKLMRKADRLKQKYWNKGDRRMYRFWANASSGFYMRTISPQCTNDRRINEALTALRYRMKDGEISVTSATEAIRAQVEMRKSFSKLYLIKLAFLKFLKYTINIK